MRSPAPITGLTNGVVYSLDSDSDQCQRHRSRLGRRERNPVSRWGDVRRQRHDDVARRRRPDRAAIQFRLRRGASTGAIGCWKDKSGQAATNNFAQATVASRPSVSTWNGLSAVNFPDTGDVLNSTSSNALYQTAFVAANVINAAGSGIIVNLLGAAGIDYNVQIGERRGAQRTEFAGLVERDRHTAAELGQRGARSEPEPATDGDHR